QYVEHVGQLLGLGDAVFVQDVYFKFLVHGDSLLFTPYPACGMLAPLSLQRRGLEPLIPKSAISLAPAPTELTSVQLRASTPYAALTPKMPHNSLSIPHLPLPKASEWESTSSTLPLCPWRFYALGRMCAGFHP